MRISHVSFSIFNTVRHRAIITPVSPLRTRRIGASTQISGSRSGHQNFWLRFQYLEAFGFGSRPISSKKQNKTLHYLYNSLAPQTICVGPETKFQLRLYHLKFLLLLQHLKRFCPPARAMQNCFRSGSTVLLRILGSLILAPVAGQFIVRLKLFSKWELSIGLDFKSNAIYKSKNIQSDMNYVLKNT